MIQLVINVCKQGKCRDCSTMHKAQGLIGQRSLEPSLISAWQHSPYGQRSSSARQTNCCNHMRVCADGGDQPAGLHPHDVISKQPMYTHLNALHVNFSF